MQGGETLLALLAEAGLSKLFSVTREFFFPTSVKVEAARLAALGEQLHECTEKVREAWQKATDLTAEAESLLAQGADPDEISRVNLKVVQCYSDAQRVHATAVVLKAKVKAKIAYMKVRYGDLERSRRAVEKAHAFVDQVQEIEDQQEEKIVRQLHHTGTWGLFREAASTENLDPNYHPGIGVLGAVSRPR